MLTIRVDDIYKDEIKTIINLGRRLSVQRAAQVARNSGSHPTVDEAADAKLEADEEAFRLVKRHIFVRRHGYSPNF